MPRVDVYKDVTERIIEALKSDGLSWIRPWNATPQNAVSRKTYNGVNKLLLSIEASSKGYKDPRWLTFKQAQNLGGHVKKGEKSVPIVFWKIVEVEKMDEEKGELVTESFPIAKYFRVFNVEQCKGLKLEPLKENKINIDDFTQKLLKLPKIQWGGNTASYSPSLDIIRLPYKGYFNDTPGFREVFFHELTHWTGHKDRLNRDLNSEFGSKKYALEELIAELGAAYLAAHSGQALNAQYTQYAAYLNSWLSVLDKDKMAIFTAAKKAQEACDYCLEKAKLLEHDKEKTTFSVYKNQTHQIAEKVRLTIQKKQKDHQKAFVR